MCDNVLMCAHTYRIAGIFAELNFRVGRFGCITVIIRGLYFCTTVVLQKLTLLPKLKTDLVTAGVLLEPI